MLPPIQNTEQIVTQRIVITTPPSGTILFDLPNDEPWLLASVRLLITSGATILIPLISIRNENDVQVTNVQRFPWQFPATTVESSQVQTPSLAEGIFFAPFLAYSIVGGLHVFNGWGVFAAAFDGAAGVTFDMTFTFEQFYDEDF